MFEVGQKVRIKKCVDINESSTHLKQLVGIISRVNRESVRVFFPLAPRDYQAGYSRSTDPVINLSYLFLTKSIESAED